MICEWCRKAAATGDPNIHNSCPGKLLHKSHCDCQHLKTRAMIEAEAKHDEWVDQAIAVPLVELRIPVKVLTDAAPVFKRSGARSRASKCSECGKTVAHRADGTLWRHKDSRNGKWGPPCWGSNRPASCDCEDEPA